MALHGEMLIDGRLVGGQNDAQFEKVEVLSPYDSHLVGKAPVGTKSALDEAVNAARRAAPIWASTARCERQMLLTLAARSIAERRKELAEIMAAEIGKPVSLGLQEVDRMAKTFELAASALESWGLSAYPVDTDSRGAGATGFASRRPLGVVLAVTPYNWPFNLAAHKLAPALAAGNVVVVKPSPKSLLSTFALTQLLHQVGFPKGVVQGVDAPNDAVSLALKNGSVDCLSFTGSAKVGWALRQIAHARTKVILELGGVAPALVLDYDYAEIVASILAKGAFAYAGQICISVQRILVRDGVYDEFREALISATRNIATGDPFDPNVFCGPVIDLEAAERIKAIVDNSGGKVIQGGTWNGAMGAPTIVENPSAGSAMVAEEAFGPVVSFETFANTAEGIAKANGTDYGIHAAVFTKDLELAQQAYEGLEFAGVVVNDSPSLRFDSLPYGGVKGSGVGREGVWASLDEFSLAKTLVVRVRPR